MSIITRSIGILALLHTASCTSLLPGADDSGGGGGPGDLVDAFVAPPVTLTPIAECEGVDLPVQGADVSIDSTGEGVADELDFNPCRSVSAVDPAGTLHVVGSEAGTVPFSLRYDVTVDLEPCGQVDCGRTTYVVSLRTAEERGCAFQNIPTITVQAEDDEVLGHDADFFQDYLASQCRYESSALRSAYALLDASLVQSASSCQKCVENGNLAEPECSMCVLTRVMPEPKVVVTRTVLGATELLDAWAHCVESTAQAFRPADRPSAQCVVGIGQGDGGIGGNQDGGADDGGVDDGGVDGPGDIILDPEPGDWLLAGPSGDEVIQSTLVGCMAITSPSDPITPDPARPVDSEFVFPHDGEPLEIEVVVTGVPSLSQVDAGMRYELSVCDHPPLLPDLESLTFDIPAANWDPVGRVKNWAPPEVLRGLPARRRVGEYANGATAYQHSEDAGCYYAPGGGTLTYILSFEDPSLSVDSYGETRIVAHAGPFLDRVGSMTCEESPENRVTKAIEIFWPAVTPAYFEHATQPDRPAPEEIAMFSNLTNLVTERDFCSNTAPEPTAPNFMFFSWQLLADIPGWPLRTLEDYSFFTQYLNRDGHQGVDDSAAFYPAGSICSGVPYNGLIGDVVIQAGAYHGPMLSPDYHMALPGFYPHVVDDGCHTDSLYETVYHEEEHVKQRIRWSRDGRGFPLERDDPTGDYWTRTGADMLSANDWNNNGEWESGNSVEWCDFNGNGLRDRLLLDPADLEPAGLIGDPPSAAYACFSGDDFQLVDPTTIRPDWPPSHIWETEQMDADSDQLPDWEELPFGGDLEVQEFFLDGEPIPLTPVEIDAVLRTARFFTNLVPCENTEDEYGAPGKNYQSNRYLH